MARIIEKYDLELIANELEKIKKVKDDKINFEAFRFEDFITILQSAIIFNKEFPECEKRRILTQSLFSCGKQGEISSKKLLKIINYNEGIFINSLKTKYKLVTSISIKYFEMLKPVKYKGYNLHFYPQLPTKYDQTEIKEKLKYSNTVITPPEYTVVVITTEGRTIHEAVENAISFFELIRGIWNFYNNRLTRRRMVTGKYIPVNTILFGPIHTLHALDGKLATDEHWYEVLYSDEIKATDITKTFSFIKSQEKIARERIKKIPYGEELKKIFIRYNNALDIIDFNTSIVNLWSILEYLTNTTEKSYAQTISRATFIYRDYKIVQQFLETLRDVRNKIVHFSERDDRGEILVYQLKDIVENLLSFHLNNAFKFSGIEELGNFLDLPKQSLALRKKYKIIKNGIKFKQVKA